MRPLVLHMRATNFFGGPERQIIGHVEKSKNSRHLVLTFNEGKDRNELAERCLERGIPVETITTSNSYSPSSIFKLRKVIKTFQPDVLCSHGYRPTILALCARVGLQKPLLCFARGHTNENIKVRFFERLELFALRYADFVIPVSNGYAQYLRNMGVPTHRMEVIRNAVVIRNKHTLVARPNRMRSKMCFTSQDLLIATAGRLSPEKAQMDLIIAFLHIKDKFPLAHLLILGDGILRGKLERVVQERSIRDVHFLGFRKDIDEIMPVIDLFVLSSTTEGLPNVLLEAFACGKPVVATAVGGVPELVENDINGLLVPARRPDLLAQAIAECLSSPKMRLTMGEEGYKKVRSDFTFESQTQKLEQIYQEVLTGRT